MADPLDEIQWKSPEWIQQFGLHTGNVLDYFTESPFFDRTSNNQVLKMQFQFQQIPNNTNPIKYFQSKLSEMTGIEFIIAFVREPDFWIIRKQKRLNRESAIPQQDYYIIGANIYQAPKIYDILLSRLLSSVLSIKNSIDLLNKMSQFNLNDGGHQYPSYNPVTNDESLSISNSATTNMNNTPMLATPSIQQTPSISQTPATTTNPATNPSSTTNEISSTTFDNLLNGVMNNNGLSIYLDDIPLYGKGSTVDQMSLKVNLDWTSTEYTLAGEIRRVIR